MAYIFIYTWDPSNVVDNNFSKIGKQKTWKEQKIITTSIITSLGPRPMSTSWEWSAKKTLHSTQCIPSIHIGYRIAFLQYRRKFWWIAIIFAICGEFSSANLCESPIFLPYTVIYLLFQFSWLLVPCLTINFGDFLCDLIVELPKFSQILVTSTVIIFVFCHYSSPIWYHFCTLIFA